MHETWEVPGAPVAGYVWRAERPRGAVLLTHGFGEYAGRYVERYHSLIPQLVRAGFSVYSYDHRGHGASGGRRAVSNLRELLTDHFAAREALRSSALPLYVFGHSMGGLIAAAGAVRDPRGLSGVILSSPALLIGAGEPPLLRRLAPLLARVAPGLPVTDLGTGGLSRLADEVSAYRADAQIYQGKVPALTASSMLGLSDALWAEYPNWRLPTLIFHGDRDTITDPQGSQRFFELIPAGDKTLRLFEGGYHELLNDEGREEVRALVLDWLDARTPRAPA